MQTLNELCDMEDSIIGIWMFFQILNRWRLRLKQSLTKDKQQFMCSGVTKCYIPQVQLLLGCFRVSIVRSSTHRCLSKIQVSTLRNQNIEQNQLQNFMDSEPYQAHILLQMYPFWHRINYRFPVACCVSGLLKMN